MERRRTVDYFARSSTTIGLDFLGDPGATLRDTSPGEGWDDVTPREDLEVLDTLGVGGMAVVRLARQASLDREIALKTPRSDRNDPRTSQLLLHEARVTGSLPHPNVVPVHDVRLDEDGNPQILLKRIEGSNWSQLLRTGARSLPDNVRILRSVCNALAFAHDRGVLHRDVKPDNVMVGDFGEVLLVDWGIAVRLVDGRYEPGRLRIVGTPSYMAPEMVAVDVQTPQTDVYLLGAVLYQLLVGRPPHTGATLEEMLATWFEPGSLPSDAPAVLASLCERALSLDPADRPPDVAAFREELTRYLELRAVDDIVEAATAELDKMRNTEALDALDAFHAARFAFRQALEAFPGHDRARAGLDDAVVLAAEVYVARQEFDAARRALTERSAPHPLSDAIDQLAEQHAAEQARIAAQLARSDTESGKGVRARMFGSMGAAGALVLLYGGVNGSPSTYPEAAAVSLFVAAAIGATAWTLRDQLAEMPFDRMAVRQLLGFPLTMSVLSIGAALQGWPMAQFESMGVMLMGVWFGFGSMLFRSRAMFGLALASTALWLFVSTFPDNVFFLNITAGLLGLWGFGVVWWREDRERAETPAP
jgi:serine/threonine-protein kinase